MDLRQLGHFVAVAEELHIGAGAVARAPEGVAVVELEGAPPVVAGIATSCEDDRVVVAAFRRAARAGVGLHGRAEPARVAQLT